MLLGNSKAGGNTSMNTSPIEFPGRVCNSKTFSTGVW